MSTHHRFGRLGPVALYAAMIAGAVGAFLLIRHHGQQLVAPAPSAGASIDLPSSHAADALMHVLLALAVVIVTARLMGTAFRYLQQPAVIGEVIGGLVLGPSFLGRIAPELQEFLLPHHVAPFLAVIAQLGIILYMFLVGLELDLNVVRKSGHVTLAISHASIIAPFLLGATLALGLYPLLSTRDVPFTNFSLFLGVSMSVTAFPVLARILTDRGLSRTRMGAISITCAAVDDATAWCLLALVVSIAGNEAGGAVRTLVLTVAFVAFILTVGSSVMRRLVPWLERSGHLTRAGLAIIFVAMLFSSLATEFIGIHAIFGAFLLGAVIPSNSRVAEDLTRRLEDVISVLFLPAFFAFTGMRTQIGLVSGWTDWAICGVILLAACAGKFGGTYSAARLSGFGWREASSLGILMNTRGLVELIVLNIGLDLGVISPTLFAMLVLMALATTFMTTPVLHLLIRNHPWAVAPVAPAHGPLDDLALGRPTGTR